MLKIPLFSPFLLENTPKKGYFLRKLPFLGGFDPPKSRFLLKSTLKRGFHRENQGFPYGNPLLGVPLASQLDHTDIQSSAQECFACTKHSVLLPNFVHLCALLHAPTRPTLQTFNLFFFLSEKKIKKSFRSALFSP